MKLFTTFVFYMCNRYWHISGADPGFQVRGGALKKIAPSGGGAKIVGKKNKRKLK
jgi:hypothetical protein